MSTRFSQKVYPFLPKKLAVGHDVWTLPYSSDANFVGWSHRRTRNPQRADSGQWRISKDVGYAAKIRSLTGKNARAEGFREESVRGAVWKPLCWLCFLSNTSDTYWGCDHHWMACINSFLTTLSIYCPKYCFGCSIIPKSRPYHFSLRICVWNFRDTEIRLWADIVMIEIHAFYFLWLNIFTMYGIPGCI